jgi:uncharacterized damage-inducible protein DinB
MLDHLRDLMAHAEWANAVFFHTWGKSPARDHEEMRRRVDHVVAVQESFLSILRGNPPSWPTEGPPPAFDPLRTRAKASHEGLSAFAGALTAEGAEAKVRVPWFPEPPCVIRVADGLIQVAMHSQHHRGQLMTRLKDLGGEPKNVDWIIWLWKNKPQGRWE